MSVSQIAAGQTGSPTRAARCVSQSCPSHFPLRTSNLPCSSHFLSRTTNCVMARSDGQKRKGEEVACGSQESQQLTPVLFADPSSRKRSRQRNADAEAAGGELKSSCSDDRVIKRQLWSPSADSLHFQTAKAGLHLSVQPEEVLCRTAEKKKLEDFCKGHLQSRKPGSLYVCGCPGTGKTLTMQEVKEKAAEWAVEVGESGLDVVAINCMALTDPRQISQKILSSLPPDHESGDASDRLTPLEEIKRRLSKTSSAGRESKKMVLVILDEMDHLMTKDQSVLYDMFMLPRAPNSRCILIGIANAIDLTDRFLPNLRALNCNPEVVSFPPYTKEQILTVLRLRIQAIPFPMFEPRALELCARKVAASSGDMRKALDVCRLALDIVEQEASSLEEGSDNSEDLALPSSQQLRTTEAEEHQTSRIPTKPQLVQVGHMAQALSGSFKFPVVETLQSLPQHQQMVLCSAVRLFRRGKKDSNLGQLNQAYCGLCKQTALRPLTAAEFSGICTVLADQALLAIGSGREERLRRVTLKIHEDDVLFALQGIRFFRNILATGASTSGGG